MSIHIPLLHQLMTVDAATAIIRTGRYLALAGDEGALGQLPTGNWIGGTIPYFMDTCGGCMDRELVFVTELPVYDEAPLIRFYNEENLPQLCANAPANGYSIIILPGMSDIHAAYAHEAPRYQDMYQKPLMGYVAGVALDDIGRTTPKVWHGQTGRCSDTQAVVMDVPLPPHRYARIDIANPFTPGDAATLVFPEGGFSAGPCLIDGQPGNLAEYLLASGADTRLPLVADYCGALVNVSIKAIDAAQGRVDFYAPVFPGVSYRVAAPVADYVAAFRQVLPRLAEPAAFACNCILNYRYGELEGRTTGDFTGPMTFGEIAYQLLNQTLVYMTIEAA